MKNAQDLIDLLDQKGDIAYDGEGITQLEHAWQCGQLALEAYANPALQLASWLHDIGHLLTDLRGSPTVDGIDDLHEESGAHVLAALWGADVAEPVRLHVVAKRYLVTTIPGYGEKLSPDSLRSLSLQGGPLSRADCLQFQDNPHHADAIKLRAWDDIGKRPGWFAQSRSAALEELARLMHMVPRK